MSKKYGDSAIAFRSISYSSPHYYQARLHLSDALFHMKKYRQAHYVLKQLLALDPPKDIAKQARKQLKQVEEQLAIDRPQVSALAEIRLGRDSNSNYSLATPNDYPTALRSSDSIDSNFMSFRLAADWPIKINDNFANHYGIDFSGSQFYQNSSANYQRLTLINELIYPEQNTSLPMSAGLVWKDDSYWQTELTGAFQYHSDNQQQTRSDFKLGSNINLSMSDDNSSQVEYFSSLDVYFDTTASKHRYQLKLNTVSESSTLDFPADWFGFQIGYDIEKTLSDKYQINLGIAHQMRRYNDKDPDENKYRQDSVLNAHLEWQWQINRHLTTSSYIDWHDVNSSIGDYGYQRYTLSQSLTAAF
ncbi:hypothetical protein [Reinekea thalattae]|uniref:DUF560 domain-containing protein n=1 Tax=Reinekea thalattae TaxID=2593301 RepID=A0A5C8Z8X0_9GAMM|nr:hypothetical protein [Reinekea thalattae]TXR53804.1 hypothetical protein FME95_04395 [Reinekea thalattae]